MFRILAVLALAACVAAKKPNILMILTDDQDVILGGANYQPQIEKVLVSQGATMKHSGFATTPVCCPSRSTLVTGRYIHNIPMTNNSIAGNCSSLEFQAGAEKLGIPTYLPDYRSLYAGKYLNQYGFPSAGGVSHIPPGWTDWYALQGNSRYYNYTLSVNGTAVQHGGDYAKDYLPDALANQTLKFIGDMANDERPFFAIVATPSCHDPTEPAPQYSGRFANLTSPRLPNYNKGAEDKNWFVRTFGNSMTEARSAVTDWQYRRRLETLLTVDDMVAAFVDKLEATNQLDNTFIFYTADHGYHLGELGLLKDKRTPYEFDIRIPMYVRGPGVCKGCVMDSIISMVDMAPTFLDIAGVDKPSQMDGRSVLPELEGKSQPVGRTFLVEFHGEHGGNPGPVCDKMWVEGTAAYIEGPEMTKTAPVFKGQTVCSVQDSTNNTYSCMRTINKTVNTQFCQWVSGFQEFYNLDTNPWQLKNEIDTLSHEERQKMTAELAKLAACSGDDCVITY
eukprot:m.128621 g.128621  ORF g.128621 m.128621 type:complete len:506 (+) comp23599_c0_seq1:2-1519(+)